MKLQIIMKSRKWIRLKYRGKIRKHMEENYGREMYGMSWKYRDYSE